MIERSSKREHWDRFWESADKVEEVYSNEGRVSKELSDILDLNGKLVLEVGAGTGRDGIMLSRMGGKVVSLDYSSESLRLIRDGLKPEDNVYPCCADAFSLPFPDEIFDVVFHQGLLEHFRNPDDLIAENVRVLKKGGMLLVDVPQKYHYYTLIKHILIFLDKWFAGWECEYSISELESLLRKHSLKIVKSYGDWFNPPIWYRMLRKGFLSLGVRLPMYPRIFTFFRKLFTPLRNFLLKKRFILYTTLVIGAVGVKDGMEGSVDQDKT